MADSRVNIYDTSYNYERELGQIITKLEYLQKELEETQQGLALGLKEERELIHTVNDITKRLDNITANVSELSSSYNKHLTSEVKFPNYIAEKLGKFIIGVLIAAATIIGIDIFKPIILSWLKTD